MKFQGHTGKSERFDSYDRPSNISKIEFKSSIFRTVWPWNLMDDLEKQWGTFSLPHQALCVISKPSVNSNWVTVQKHQNLGQNRWFFSRVTFKIDGWLNSHGLVVKSQACHAEGPGFAPGVLQGVLFPMAAHHTTLAWQWARDCGALFTYHQPS